MEEIEIATIKYLRILKTVEEKLLFLYFCLQLPKSSASYFLGLSDEFVEKTAEKFIRDGEERIKTIK